jgi:cell wall-associated NlpC family hydrolase
MPLAIVAGAAAGVMTLVVGVSLAGGIGSTSAQPAGTGLLAGNLTAAAVRDPALAPWVVKAGSLCPTFPPSVIAAQIQTESGWSPAAVSPGGAVGDGQLMPATFAAYGANDAGTGQADPLNPVDSIMAAGRYDCALAAQESALATGTGVPLLSLALAAYNAGPQAVADTGGIPPYPETQAYVANVEALAATLVARPPASAFGQAVLTSAEAWIGTPYVWGGGTPSGPSGSPAGFDCSGLVLYAVYQASRGTVVLPHSSELQATMGQAVDPASLQPGDVIALQLKGPGDFDHIVIFAGNGEVIAAPHTGGVVQVQPLSDFAGAPFTVRRFG